MRKIATLSSLCFASLFVLPAFPAEEYERVDPAISCVVKMKGVFGDGNQLVQETIKISRVECWLKDAPNAKKELELKSNSGAAGFIETKEFGRIKFKSDSTEFFMRKADQASLMRGLRK